MGILIRILLVLVPFLALFSFIRYRSKALGDEGALENELKALRTRLLLLLLVFASALFGLYWIDDSGEAGQCYVPAKTVDGKVQPGYFVPFDDPACPKK